MQEIDELFKIFRALGTPSEETWPGVTRDYPDYKETFPRWQPRPLQEVSVLSRYRVLGSYLVYTISDPCSLFQAFAEMVWSY